MVVLGSSVVPFGPQRERRQTSTPPNPRIRLTALTSGLPWIHFDTAHAAIHARNNSPTNTSVGLFAGKRGKIRIRSKKPSGDLKKGQEVYMFIYKYRPDKEFNIDDLLTFDTTLLHPHPDTGVPVVNPEEGRVLRPGPPTTDALRIVVPFDTNRLELGFTVNASAPDVLKPDGPGETHGRYLLDLFHQHAPLFFQGRNLVVQQIGGRAFPATDGALLRR